MIFSFPPKKKKRIESKLDYSEFSIVQHSSIVFVTPIMVFIPSRMLVPRLDLADEMNDFDFILSDI